MDEQKHITRPLAALPLLGILAASTAGAVVPVEVGEQDGLIGFGAVIKSPQREAELGSGMAVGDFNGDGMADLAVGAPRQASSRGIEEAGVVSIFYGGGAMAPDLGVVETVDDGVEDVVLEGAETNGFVGQMLAAGDLNGDGIDDLAIVAQRVNDTGAPVDPEDAEIFVLFGSSSLSGTKTLSGVANAVIRRQDSMHVAAIAIGDISGDGVADLVFSDDLTDSVTHPPVAPRVDGFPRGINGAVYVYYGGRLDGELDPEETADAIIMRNGGEGIFQVKGIAVGNVDGSGAADLLLGAPAEDSGILPLEEAGATYVVPGGGSINYLLDIDAIATSRIYGGVKGDQAGERLASGDIDGDGTDDIIIGAPLSGWGETSTTGKGRVYLVLGKHQEAEMDLYDQADATFALSESVARIGFKTGNALLVGDVDGDDTEDLMISSTNAFARSGTNGWTHVLYGRTSWASSYELDVEADIAVVAPESTPTPSDPLSAGRMGSTLGLGDFDGDGHADIALGAPWGKGNNSMVGNGWVGVLFDPVRGARERFDWQVAEIYIATLGYAPDDEGLQYWVENLGAGIGWTPTTVAQSFFDAPLVEAMYPPDQDYGVFINALYQNLFGRSPDDAGYAYWLNELQSGSTQRNEMIIALINGGWANPDAAQDMKRFSNRVQVALRFVAEQAERGIVYSQLSGTDQEALRQMGSDVLSALTADPATRDAAIAQIPALLDSLD
ncbi:DUF4214 domain-containing protein [Thiorhodococcus minor]|uniref:DUF4214 domain-containing protein n=1 Tax=Thiorhodococcus minor TaxID=57489 RepID=A0A6M0JYD6_9GAMM|nr:DUF4214 domain-containing protein [Thiorhodococcus minor]NEV61115.1 DUF4214 domain-containing protein [Thiorhodococcus minor]